MTPQVFDGRGRYLAVKSEAEVYEAEIAREKAESKKIPKKRSRNVAFYQTPGIQSGKAQRMAEHWAKILNQLVQAMAPERTWAFEHRFPSPWKSSASAAISTAIGAFIPIVPFSS